MRRTIRIVVLTAAALVAALILRPRLDVNVFNLLPRDSPMVDGLRLYQQSFASPRGLILSVRAADAEVAEEAARCLAEELERAELTPHAVWQSPFRDDPEAAAELIAYLWLNQPPAEFETLAASFGDEELGGVLDTTFERMTTSLSPAEVTRLARDPFALTDLARSLAGGLGAENPFASADGSFRILFNAALYGADLAAATAVNTEFWTPPERPTAGAAGEDGKDGETSGAGADGAERAGPQLGHRAGS